MKKINIIDLNGIAEDKDDDSLAFHDYILFDMEHFYELLSMYLYGIEVHIYDHMEGYFYIYSSIKPHGHK